MYKQFINKNDLIREYVQFSKCYYNFEAKKYLPFKLHNNGNDRFLDNDSDVEKTDESSSYDNLEIETKNGELSINGNSMATILQVLKISSLTTLFPHLCTSLKIGVTLSLDSATTERSFSKLSILKSKLRSTMIENRLDALMIISCESDIDINIDSVIDTFSKNSSFLLNSLVY